MIEDVKSEAPIEAPVVYSETNGGAGGSSAAAPAEAPVVSTDTNVNSGGSFATAEAGAADVCESSEDKEKAIESGNYTPLLYSSEYSG